MVVFTMHTAKTKQRRHPPMRGASQIQTDPPLLDGAGIGAGAVTGASTLKWASGDVGMYTDFPSAMLTSLAAVVMAAPISGSEAAAWATVASAVGMVATNSSCISHEG